MSNVTTCPECRSEYYEFPTDIETRTLAVWGPRRPTSQRLVYTCENGHVYYGPWSDYEQPVQ